MELPKIQVTWSPGEMITGHLLMVEFMMEAQEEAIVKLTDFSDGLNTV